MDTVSNILSKITPTNGYYFLSGAVTSKLFGFIPTFIIYLGLKYTIDPSESEIIFIHELIKNITRGR